MKKLIIRIAPMLKIVSKLIRSGSHADEELVELLDIPEYYIEVYRALIVHRLFKLAFEPEAMDSLCVSYITEMLTPEHLTRDMEFLMSNQELHIGVIAKAIIENKELDELITESLSLWPHESVTYHNVRVVDNKLLVIDYF